MRIFVPATLRLLVAAQGSGRLDGSVSGAGSAGGGDQDVDPRSAYAVTPALREWYTEGDAEELEYAAMLDAAAASLRLLAMDRTCPRRRVVLAAEVPDAQVRPADHERSAVRLAAAPTLSQVVAVHVDDDEATSDITAAVQALGAADAGDEDARFLVDGADGHDLLWYDVTELDDVVADLTGGG